MIIKVIQLIAENTAKHKEKQEESPITLLRPWLWTAFQPKAKWIWAKWIFQDQEMSLSVLASALHSKSCPSTIQKPMLTLPAPALVLGRIGSPYKVNVQGPQGGFCPDVVFQSAPQNQNSGNSTCYFTVKFG